MTARTRRTGLWVVGGISALYLLSLFLPYDVVGDVMYQRANQPPSLSLWLGSDHMGRSIGQRLLHGIQSFYLPGLGAAVMTMLVGTLSGALAGWWGGFPALLLRYINRVLGSIPRLVLALLMVAILSTQDAPLMVLAAACTLGEIPLLAESVCAGIEDLRHRDFVAALQAHGVRPSRILGYHLLYVNLWGPIARHGLYTFGQFLVLEATLSYLGGFGVPEPAPSWGNMIAFELGVAEGNLWAWLAPALALYWVIVGTLGLSPATPDLATLPVAPVTPPPAIVPPIPAGDRLEVRHLRLQTGQRYPVQDCSWALGRGEVVALVGPSGSGKSLTLRAALGLLPSGIRQVGGSIHLVQEGQDHLLQNEADFKRIRGEFLTLIDQDARAALDPSTTVGMQVAQSAVLNQKAPDPLPWLQAAGFTEAERVARLFPHELSGGMAQRVTIALALARGSRFLMADECTSGLDPSLQETVLDHLLTLRQQGVGILLVTHDLRLLPGRVDRIIVMEQGVSVEAAATPAELQGIGKLLLDATRRIAGGRL